MRQSWPIIIVSVLSCCHIQLLFDPAGLYKKSQLLLIKILKNSLDLVVLEGSKPKIYSGNLHGYNYEKVIL